MPNQDHINLLAQRGTEIWNAWRAKEPQVRPDLSSADLRNANLVGTNLHRANLRGADLSGADLSGADVSNADLRKATLVGATLIETHLNSADLSKAKLQGATLGMAQLRRANLSDAKLHGADLKEVNLSWANLSGAILSGADLRTASLVETDMTGADLTGCRVYGISAWRLKGKCKNQENLIVTPSGEPEITTDNIEIAQFLDLMLHNAKLATPSTPLARRAFCSLGVSPAAGSLSWSSCGKHSATAVSCRSSSTLISQRRSLSPRPSGCSPVYPAS
jgi:uncharacterized protein YjbI with pentapeptide repeats